MHTRHTPLHEQETKKIKEAGLDRDREQEVLAQLLHKETKLLQTIDRLKINANHENKDLRIQNTLGKMSQVRVGPGGVTESEHTVGCHANGKLLAVLSMCSECLGTGNNLNRVMEARRQIQCLQGNQTSETRESLCGVCSLHWVVLRTNQASNR